MRLTLGKEAKTDHSEFLSLKGVWFVLTYGSGSRTSFFFRSNWSFDILLKCGQNDQKKLTK